MNLGRIRTKLDRNGYAAIRDFAKDVRSVLENAISYKASLNQAALVAAKKLLNLFETEMERRNIVEISCAWEQILEELISVEEIIYFCEPVDPVTLGILDYPYVVAEPMDLGAVRVKLRAGRYENVKKLLSDVRLVFRNAMTFNYAAIVVFVFAKKLKKCFKERMRSLTAPESNLKCTVIKSEILMTSIIDQLQAEPCATYFVEPIGVFQSIVASLNADTSSLYFRTPVDPVMDIPKYSTIITQHLDLSRVAALVDTSVLTSLDTLQTDLNLVIANVTAFNQNPQNVIYVAALSFRSRVAATLEYTHFRRPLSLPQCTTTTLKAGAPPPSRKILSAVLRSLLRDPSVKAYFLVPVDSVALGIPDYETVVTRPMDIGTIKARLKQGRYKGATDFAADVHLVFFNAMLYNSNPNHAVHAAAARLDILFNRTLANALGYEIPRENPPVYDHEAPRNPINQATKTRAMLRCAQGPFDAPPSRNEMRVIIEALQAKKDETIYNPVDPGTSEGDYSLLVSDVPITLSTIRSNLDTYASLGDFAVDVRKILDNACTGALDLAVRHAAKILSYLFENKLACVLAQVRAEACNTQPHNNAKRQKQNPREETARNRSDTVAPATPHHSLITSVSCTPVRFNYPPLHLNAPPEDDADDDTEIASYSWHNITARLVLPSSPPSSSVAVADAAVLETLWRSARDESLLRLEHATRKH